MKRTLIGQFKLIMAAHWQELLDPSPLTYKPQHRKGKGLAGQTNHLYDNVLYLVFNIFMKKLVQLTGTLIL